MSIRTKNEFNDAHKLSPRNTVEAILEQERMKNPYSVDKHMRVRSKGLYSDNSEVKRMKA